MACLPDEECPSGNLRETDSLSSAPARLVFSRLVALEVSEQWRSGTGPRLPRDAISEHLGDRVEGRSFSRQFP